MNIDVKWAIVVMLVALLPMAIRLWKVREVRRPVHWFDDVVSYLNLPVVGIVLLVPMSRVATGSLVGVLGVITVVSIYRLGRNIGTAREP